MLANAGSLDALTYAIPDELSGQIAPGHRVVIPLRSRQVTGIVVETGATLDDTAGALKPITEILEPRPILDAAHLELLKFAASYYLSTLGEVIRSVIPGAFRVETHRVVCLAHAPDALALASFNPLERALLDTLGLRPRTVRQLARLGAPREVAAAIARLESHGLIQYRDATRGRHRDRTATVASLAHSAGAAALRGPRQRELVALLREAGSIAVDQIAERIPGAAPVLRALAARGVVELRRAEALAAQPQAGAEQPTLTDEQSLAVRAIAPALTDQRFEPFLLWGVTSSGKTEVYLRLAAQCLRAGRHALILVPEIALTDQVVRSVQARFGRLVAVAHSGQNVAERWANWTSALSGEARILVGPRSAVFAPIHDLGLIVVDEEHDPSYKNEEGLRYNARDLAVALARFSRCPVLLGSATPSAESFFNARSGRYRMLRLMRRIGDRPFARVEVIDLREALRAREQQRAIGAKTSDTSDTKARREPAPVPLSDALIAALRANLAAGGQSIVFINRRGYHNFLQCHLCGNVISCRNCSVSMTFHLRDRSLRCHYCGAREAAPETCPECRGFGLEGQGFGTERMASTLAQLLPTARIERMDSDTTRYHAVRTQILEGLRRGELDVLVGTQMITKGLDFPGVTLVGVVAADMALNMPDFRSAERGFQLMTQVAGRAGRGERPGHVIMQTYAPHHYSIRAARDQDYARFMRRELQLRRELFYPPFARLALVRIEGEKAAAVEEVAARVARALSSRTTPAQMRVLGPAPAPIERIKQRYRWQVLVKSQALGTIRAALAAMRAEVAAVAEHHGVRVAIDLDPVNMM